MILQKSFNEHGHRWILSHGAVCIFIFDHKPTIEECLRKIDWWLDREGVF
jgi:hypothetical protein